MLFLGLTDRAGGAGDVGLARETVWSGRVWGRRGWVAWVRDLRGRSIDRLLNYDGVRGGRGDLSLRLFIRGDHSVVGCVYEVGVGEGGGLLSVSVLIIAASLFFSSFGGCSSSEFTSGASAEAGGTLATVGLLVSGRGWTVPLMWVGWTVPLMWVGWTVPLMWVGSKVFLKVKICLKIYLKLIVVAFKVEVGINSSLPKAVKFSDEAV